MGVKVKWDPSGLRILVERWMVRQVPFVLSRALNATVLEARTELREELPKTFTIRNSRTAKGLRVNFATKINPTAAVGTIDEYMARQALGGRKVGGAGGVAVPMQGRGRGRPRQGSKTGQARWPGALKRKRGGFFRPGKGQSTLLFLPRRGGRLLLAYVILPEIKVKERWDLEGVLRRVARAEWTDNVKIAWETARRSARR